MEFWNLFFIKSWGEKKKIPQNYLGTIRCGEENADLGLWAEMWAAHTSWRQTQLGAQAQRMDWELRNTQTPLVRATPAPGAAQGTPSSSQRVQEAAGDRDTNPGVVQPWIAAMGLSHAELIDQLLLPCLPQHPAEVTLSHSFLIFQVVILSQEPAWSRHIYSSQNDMKWFQLQLG